MEPKKVLKTRVVPDPDHAPWTLDHIRCPKCKTTQAARIFENGSKTVYRHQCIKCEYIITKKDWKSIQ